MAFVNKQQKTTKNQKSEIITGLLTQNTALPRGIVPLNTSSPDSINSGSSSVNEFTPLYFPEISQMMRGFGDCEVPLKESVILVEKIVVKQMKSLINDVVQVAIKRCGSPIPCKKDFEFLMRKNPIKLQRLKKYIKGLYDVKKNLKIKDEYDPSNCFQNEDEDEMFSDEEIVEKHDEEKTRRLFRADHISQSINMNDYIKFSNARKTSFNNLKSKIRQWLNISPDIKLKQMALEIISFLARDTVATIVDYCILTRLNSSNRQTDPFCRTTSTSVSYEALHLCPDVTQSRGLDGVKAITVQEINEAMRRVNTMATKKMRMGMFRNGCIDYKIPYLAL